MKRKIKYAYEISKKPVQEKHNQWVCQGDCIPDFVCNKIHNWFPCIGFYVRHINKNNLHQLNFSSNWTCHSNWNWVVSAEDCYASMICCGCLRFDQHGEICIDW